MKLIRFMSSKEFYSLIKGDDLINKTNHRDEGKYTNSIGFCFLNADEFQPDFATEFLPSTIIRDNIFVEFEVTDKNYINKTWGTYANPIKGDKNSMTINEYSTEFYNKNILHPIRFGEVSNIILKNGDEKTVKKYYSIELINNKNNDNNIFKKEDIFKYENNKEVIIPESVSQIDKYSFFDEKDLKEIKLPKSLKKIDSYAFFNCKSLKAITIPENVEYINETAFINCPNLTIINKSDLNLDYLLKKNPNLVFDNNYEEKILLNRIVTIPDEITNVTIKNFKGYDIEEIRKIILPSNLSAIEPNTFNNFTALKEINLPDKLKKIGCSAFKNCESLEKIDLPNNIKEIQNHAFSECTSLKEINLPSKLEKIERCVFAGCKSLEKITLPNNIKEIQNHAFSECTSLKEINLPSKLEKIERCVFAGCKSLEKITLPNNIKEIQSHAFLECESLKEINMSNNIKEIGALVFSKCKSLEKINLPNNLKKIDMFAFLKCESLKEITIPENVENISELAFNGCDNLTIINKSNLDLDYLLENNPNLKIINDNEPDIEYETFDDIIEKIKKIEPLNNKNHTKNILNDLEI